MRSCSAGAFSQSRATGRPCLMAYIDKCSAPCVDRITAVDHRALASVVAGAQQVLITAAVDDDVPPELDGARYRVESSRVRRE